MPGTKNRVHQPPSNARVRRAAHRERRLREHRKPSVERQARLHPTRAVQAMLKPLAYMIAHQADHPGSISAASIEEFLERNVATAHPLPWRAPDVKVKGEGWQVLDAAGELAEYASSRDKARARAKEING